MKVAFTHKKKKIEIPFFGASQVKLYAVSKNYSKSGYFAAVWRVNDLEPVPACAGEDIELLAQVEVVQVDDAYTFHGLFCKEGVRYA